MLASPPNDPSPETPGGAPPFWRRLFYRWFVEYNPLYLVSAALVLGGLFLCSRELAGEGSVAGILGVAAIAEIYAASLIGGAALLTRIGHRRPAVMLALLAVLYQGDLTLQTETCAYLGGVAPWAAAAWLAIFMAKLHALAWAMKVRLSRSAVATFALGAAGLAAFPFLIERLDARAASMLVAAWIFALGSLARPGSVTSLVPLDAWARIVLRRAVRAAWLSSALLLAGHVLFWASEHRLPLAPLLAIMPLLLVRHLRGEVHVWAVSLGTLALVGAKLPDAFSLTALAAAAALTLRALGPLARPASPGAADHDPSPYRAGLPPGLSVIAHAEAPSLPLPLTAAARMRLLTGALFAAYLSAWTLGWSGGAWPAHVLALDVAMAAVVLALAWRARLRIALAPLSALALHFAFATRLVPIPRSLLEWGGAAVGLGFALLLASLATAYRLRAPAPAVRAGETSGTFRAP
jgi:hypothetical protein